MAANVGFGGLFFFFVFVLLIFLYYYYFFKNRWPSFPQSLENLEIEITGDRIEICVSPHKYQRNLRAYVQCNSNVSMLHFLFLYICTSNV